MARVDSIARAREVFEYYKHHTDLKPVQLHTGVKSQRDRDRARKQILAKESRILVCVDMLGEGFDLPELKIAAFHDIRKSLAVTLQLAGRFTRSRADLGDATFIANVADVNVQEELQKLYTRDPDWNVLLPDLSEQMIGQQSSLQEFVSNFTDFPAEIPLKAVRPATSTVVYSTRCDFWLPDLFRAGIPSAESCERFHHSLNQQENTLVIVTARRLGLQWTDAESLFDWQWELYVVFWDSERELLFINSSSNSGDFKELAQALTGDKAKLISG
ncbi:DEAD/DEAH box helicase [Tunturiibacter lichenicola]|uniref:DEAD/DEAH box helicase n=1 Tax=Tunturiibacter lichenicola TaxID=2051959 RepID=UPI003D9ABBAE